jgi:hypothetical protein
MNPEDLRARQRRLTADAADALDSLPDLMPIGDKPEAMKATGKDGPASASGRQTKPHFATRNQKASSEGGGARTHDLRIKRRF